MVERSNAATLRQPVDSAAQLASVPDSRPRKRTLGSMDRA